MRILYIGMKYDYGNPAQGLSFEHCNMFDSLRHMGHDILYFDFLTLHEKYGKARMNQRLWEVVKEEKPDLMFTILFQEQLDRRVIRKISDNSGAVTFNWFCDDHWRFDNFSRFWAPCFHWVSTTAQSALVKYAGIGYSNVIKTQWAGNPFLYKQLELPLQHDVTFIGQPHGNRREIINALQDAGIHVKTWGSGWGNGRVTQEEVVRIFNESRVNLNLVEASVPAGTTSAPLRRMVSRSLNALPFGPEVKSLVKQVKDRQHPLAPHQTAGEKNSTQYAAQIKGRNFEVPCCGGFMLTGSAENLDDYYEAGTEVASFTDTQDLIAKVQYFLSHDSERSAIAQAGLQRTLSEHTYVHRFTEIFERMELPCDSARTILSSLPMPGIVQEIS